MLDCPHGEKVFLNIPCDTNFLISIHACCHLFFCPGSLRTFSSSGYRSPVSPHGACAAAPDHPEPPLSLTQLINISRIGGSQTGCGISDVV